MKPFRILMSSAFMLTSLLSASFSAHSAIAPDRTRVIFNGEEKSVTIALKNSNPSLPYLAQVWIDNDKLEKDTTYFIAQPPLQRIEPNSEGQIRIQPLPGAVKLPQDRESLFYFNVREIPPKPEKSNTLQLALQTRIKFFYRPAAVTKLVDKLHPWQLQLTLSRQNDEVIIDNPTPFYVVVSRVGNRPDVSVSGFKNIVLEPRAHIPLGIKSSELSNTPAMTYVDDFGGRRLLVFTCSGNNCKVDEDKSHDAEKKANK